MTTIIPFVAPFAPATTTTWSGVETAVGQTQSYAAAFVAIAQFVTGTAVSGVAGANQPFNFGATFDGASYNVIVSWNYYGQRYYVNVYNSNGTLQYAKPMIASPDDFDIDLNYGYFDTPLIFRDSSQSFEIG